MSDGSPARDDGPPRTADGHHVVIDGRRWRASDPALSEELRAALVAELMAARRAVDAATDTVSERRARDRVQDAKVGLGERGHPWWEEADEAQVRDRLAAALRALARGAGGGAVPLADLAPLVPEDRRGATGLLHDVAAALVGDGDVAWSVDGRDAVVAA